MLNRPLPAPARDVAILIGRVVLGVVLFAHGWQKLMINGIAGTYAQFDKLGIPLAIVSASFASFVEFVGGVLIILGALTTTVVALDLVVMVGAAGFVHFTHGIFAQNGGWELVGVIVAAELALAAFGPGRFSVDHLVARRHQRERDEMRRRAQTPLRRAESLPATFTPAVDAAAARSYPSGAFAVVDPGVAAATGGFPTAAPAEAPTGAFRAVGPVPAGVPAEHGTARTEAVGAVPWGAGVARTARFEPGAAEAARSEANTGPLPASTSLTAAEVASTPYPAAARGPVMPSVAACSDTAVATSPRMASAGVHRAMAERSGLPEDAAPSPFGVTVQSPLDFTPTTAIPVVPATPATQMIAIATTGELARRVRPYA